MNRPRWGAAVAMLLLVSAACSGNSGPGGASPPTDPTSLDPPAEYVGQCTDAHTDKTDIGITEHKIFVEVIADVTAPGTDNLFRDAVDAVTAWAKQRNDDGGLACRKVEVRDWDSAMSPGEAAAGITQACKRSVALVGTTSLAVLDTLALSTCPDHRLASIGLPDLAGQVVEVPHQCNVTTFSMASVPGACPYPDGARRFTELVGPLQFFRTIEPNLHGPFLLPDETPATATASAVTVRAGQLAGLFVNDGEVAATVNNRTESATRALDLANRARSTFAYSEANANVLSEMRKLARSGGGSSVKVWGCSATCYTRSFAQNGDNEGTYVWLPHLPVEEANLVPALQEYVAAIGGADRATTSGINAWAAAKTFEQVVERIVERDGYNGVSRAKILAELTAMRATAAPIEPTGGGIYGDAHVLGGPPNCFVMLRVVEGKFRRVHPVQPGTLDCKPDNVVTVDIDPSTVLSPSVPAPS